MKLFIFTLIICSFSIASYASASNQKGVSSTLTLNSENLFCVEKDNFVHGNSYKTETPYLILDQSPVKTMFDHKKFKGFLAVEDFLYQYDSCQERVEALISHNQPINIMIDTKVATIHSIDGDGRESISTKETLIITIPDGRIFRSIKSDIQYLN